MDRPQQQPDKPKSRADLMREELARSTDEALRSAGITLGQHAPPLIDEDQDLSTSRR